LVSYRTNEISALASIIALLLAPLGIFSLPLGFRLKVTACLGVSILTVLFVVSGLPVLFIWLFIAAVKLILLRAWSLLFLFIAAFILPFGGGIGAPIYGLFAIVVGVYVTPLGWVRGEQALSFLAARHIWTAIIASVMAVGAVRAGMQVPVLTSVANPLLAERERTYQLERILSWLHNSPYCDCDIAFVRNGGNPADAVEEALNRRNRPPASLPDVRDYWNAIMRCQKAASLGERTVVVTFGQEQAPASTALIRVPGRYAGEATAWIRYSQN
jgi:hypothetical protein